MALQEGDHLNILVVRTDKLGDFITTLPAIYALKMYDEKFHISVCVSALCEDLALKCWFIDRVVVDDKQNIFAFAKMLRELDIEISFTMFSNSRVAVAQALARIPTRVAPATKAAQFLYNKRIVQRRSKVQMSEFEYNLELCRAVFKDMQIRVPTPLLEFSDAALVESFLDRYAITRDIVAIHPGSGGSNDANFSVDEYVHLVKRFALHREYQTLLTFGPDEQELRDEFASRLQGVDVILYISRGSVVEFATLLSSFKLFVSASTGTYHLASAVGVETHTLFASSRFASALRWRGVGDVKLQHSYTLSSDESLRKRVLLEIESSFFG